ncbi:hypothetical protein [Nonomuraea diastatica]|uniref:Uncharacterized protein n=1 Tax=Nonomuraea diastatica TaxID=1848329 RepID=A0A4R4WXX5_9ACTN|nr:hypothetical protein [Nonomuraea diastatica]TDD22605.1 hypothetical protein E1294_11500 [Nonomuraea diastatica]
MDQALADVLAAVSTASRTRALQNVVNMASQNVVNMASYGDRQQLSARLETMTLGQLVEVAAAARLLSAAADQALAGKARHGRALQPIQPGAPDGSDPSRPCGPSVRPCGPSVCW